MKKLLFLLIALLAIAAPGFAAPTNTSGPWGIDAGGFKNLSTALSAPITAGKVIVVTKPMTINNKTITGDRFLKVMKGGSINVASGKTLAINGLFEGTDGCFTGPGGVLGLLEATPDMFTVNAIPGTTDMGPAMVKAVKAAKKVTWKPGAVYYQSVSVAAPGVNDRILVANGATLKTTATSNFSQIYLDITNSGWDISGFKFVGAANTGAYAVGVYGVDCYQSSSNYIHHNSFDQLHIGTYLRDDGLTGAGTNPVKNRVNDNVFYTMIEWQGGYGGYGVLSVKTNYTQILDNRMYGPLGRHGIYLSAGTRNSTTSGNQIYNSSWAGISIYMNVAGDDIYGNIVSDNHIYGLSGTVYNVNHHGIAMAGTCYNNSITNNFIKNIGDNGILLQSSDATKIPFANTINNNQIVDVASMAIQLMDAYSNVVSGNIIIGNNGANATTNSLTITPNNTASANGNLVSGNTFLAPKNNTRYNIVFAAGTSGNIAQGNSLYDTLWEDISDAGNNQVLPTAGGIQTVASASSITVVPTAGEVVQVTAGHNITFADPAYRIKGERLTFQVTQDATGGRSITWGSSFKVNWSNTGNTAGKKSIVSFICDGTYYVQSGAQVPYF